MLIVLLGLGAALLLAPGAAPMGRRRAAALSGQGRLHSGNQLHSGNYSSRETAGVRRPATPSPGALAVAGCGVCATVGTAAAGPVVGTAAAVAGGVVGWLVVRAVGRRKADRRAGQLLSAVRLLGAELAAGADPAAALGAAADGAPWHAAAFRAAAAAIAAGKDPGAPLERLPELAPVAAAWRVAEQAGAPLAAVLDRVGNDLADRAACARAVTVATAGARSSAALLALLPLLGVALGAALGARPGRFLFDSSAGRVVLLLGVLLDAAGTVWTVRLVDAASRSR